MLGLLSTTRAFAFNCWEAAVHAALPLAAVGALSSFAWRAEVGATQSSPQQEGPVRKVRVELTLGSEAAGCAGSWVQRGKEERETCFSDT